MVHCVDRVTSLGRVSSLGRVTSLDSDVISLLDLQPKGIKMTMIALTDWVSTRCHSIRYDVIRNDKTPSSEQTIKKQKSTVYFNFLYLSDMSCFQCFSGITRLRNLFQLHCVNCELPFVKTVSGRSVCMQACLHNMCMHVYVRTCTYVRVRTYVRTYVHTHSVIKLRIPKVMWKWTECVWSDCLCSTCKYNRCLMTHSNVPFSPYPNWMVLFSYCWITCLLPQSEWHPMVVEPQMDIVPRRLVVRLHYTPTMSSSCG